MTSFALASASPRRRHLLSMVGFRFEVDPSDVDETFETMDPRSQAIRLAALKAADVGARHPGRWILAADTIVVFGDEQLAKPLDEADAVRMLRRLSGHTHEVVTGVSLRKDGIAHDFAVTTLVTFADLSDAEIEAYVATGSPMDKAGAYGIQDDLGALFIERIDGCYYNVVGLPLRQVYATMKRVAPELIPFKILNWQL
jgi:septum formation protein